MSARARSSMLVLLMASSIAGAQQLLSQSADGTTVVPGTQVTCNAAGLHAESRFLRAYDLGAAGIDRSVIVKSLRVGVEFARAENGTQTQPAELRIYHDPTPPAPAPLAELHLIACEPISLVDGGPGVRVFPLPAAVTAPCGNLVIELFLPAGAAASNVCFPGANQAGETAPSFLVAPACGVTEPTTPATLGLGPFHLILDVTVDPVGNRMSVPPGLQRGDVLVAVDNVQPTDTQLDLSTDGGATWRAATMTVSSPSPNPLIGAPAGVADFAWDSRADGIAATGPAPVHLRATSVAGLASFECTAVVIVDNSALCAASCGDCDLDGTPATILDSLAAALLAVGLHAPSGPLQLACCDVDASLIVDVLDSLQIAQAATGLPRALTCP